jgi:circadian clock protein KaiC
LIQDRLSAGNARIDEVLGGGLPANAINLVIGAPGSGKTILSQQYVFHNATAERPALYLSTVSEPFDKIIRYGQAMNFFDAKAVGSRVLYEDLGAALRDGGLDAVLSAVDRLIKEHRPGIVVIDSFKALGSFAKGEADFRRFLHDLAGRLTAVAASSFWVGEYSRESAVDAAEFAVADSIIALTTKRTLEREIRVLQVLKLRGSGFLSGEHAYRISPDGINLFPRLADPIDVTDYQLGTERHSTGVAALDDLLGDGYWPGSATLVAGPSGIGKTLMGLHFIFNGAKAGQPGLIASLQENRVQLERVVKGFGWSLDTPDISLFARSPVDMYIDEWVYDLLAEVEHHGCKRILIDSLVDLAMAAGDDRRFREWMYSLTQRCSRAGVSLMMTMEIPELFAVTRVSENGMSHLSDNVVLLQYVKDQDFLYRALTVLKTRASNHQPAVRRYEITRAGITLSS